MKDYILAIDQGTTSSRAIIFDRRGLSVASSQMEFTQFFPEDGWVEHNPEEIWDTTVKTCLDAMDKANLTAEQLAGIGITNQRETTIVWDRATGKPIYNAIVWQDRRTVDQCEAIRNNQQESIIIEKTGLWRTHIFLRPR